MRKIVLIFVFLLFIPAYFYLIKYSEGWTNRSIVGSIADGQPHQELVTRSYTVERVIDGDTIKLTNGEEVQLFGSLINSNAKKWDVSDWFNSSELTLKDLKGKVVLVRWWTAPHCPYCSNSALALNEFYEQYHDEGLEVIGFYHHKSKGTVDIEKVKEYSKNLNFKFPIAVDYEWKTLKDWWLNGSETSWTSVTFLIDKNGIIRHIHPGGQYVKGDKDYTDLKSAIELLLKEQFK